MKKSRNGEATLWYQYIEGTRNYADLNGPASVKPVSVSMRRTNLLTCNSDVMTSVCMDTAAFVC